MAYPGFEGLLEGGARSIARKIFSHAPHLRVLEDSWLTKEGCFRPSNDEKTLFKERILEASKFIVGRSCQLSIIIDNICAEVLSWLLCQS